MKEQFNFEQLISQKMNDFQPVAPNGAWESLSHQLPTEGGSGIGSSLSIKSIIGSVAVASTIVVGTMYYQSNNTPPQKPIKELAVAAATSESLVDHKKDSNQIILNQNEPNSVISTDDNNDNDTDGGFDDSGDIGGSDSVVIITDSLDSMYGGPGSRKKIGDNDDEGDGDDLTADNNSDASSVDNSDNTVDLAIATSKEEGHAPFDVTLSINKDVNRIKWTINELGFVSMEKSPSITIDKPGEYLVNVITEDQDGNFESSVKWITVKPEVQTEEEFNSGAYDIALANFFTPNDDGFNDTYGLTNEDANQITNYKMTIVNINGRVVFDSQDPNERWDGTMTDGSLAENGVYFVVVNYANAFNEIQPVKKTTITLRR